MQGQPCPVGHHSCPRAARPGPCSAPPSPAPRLPGVEPCSGQTGDAGLGGIAGSGGWGVSQGWQRPQDPGEAPQSPGHKGAGEGPGLGGTGLGRDRAGGAQGWGGTGLREDRAEGGQASVGNRAGGVDRAGRDRVEEWTGQGAQGWGGDRAGQDKVEEWTGLGVTGQAWGRAAGSPCYPCTDPPPGKTEGRKGAKPRPRFPAAPHPGDPSPTEAPGAQNSQAGACSSPRAKQRHTSSFGHSRDTCRGLTSAARILAGEDEEDGRTHRFADAPRNSRGEQVGRIREHAPALWGGTCAAHCSARRHRLRPPAARTASSPRQPSPRAPGCELQQGRPCQRDPPIILRIKSQCPPAVENCK